MKQACKLLEGVHNFKKFCKIDKSDESYESKNYERRIFEIDIFECKNDFLFPFQIEGNFINNDYYKPYFCLIKGSAFLWHQVRCIMGILFLIGNELEDIDLINQMLNPNTDYNFLYPIADDSNLVLTDCVFEFVNLNSNDSNEISSDLFFKLEKVYQDNLIQSVVNTHFFNVMFNTNLNFFQMLNDEKKGKKDIFNLINNNFRRKQKYTKMLQHKINRDKHKKNN
jgi:tRNA pseudouridine38/39 synthase